MQKPISNIADILAINKINFLYIKSQHNFQKKVTKFEDKSGRNPGFIRENRVGRFFIQDFS